MKYFVAVLCLAQIVFSAPNEPTIVEQASTAIASAQASATAAVSELNQKVLEATGVKSNAELLATVQQQGESYASQIKGVADQITEQVSALKPGVEDFIGSIARQLSSTAANLLGEDQGKVDKLQKSFSDVLTQTNTLNTKLQEQGAAAQSTFAETLQKLYDNTLQAAKKVAVQFDEQAKKQ